VFNSGHDFSCVILTADGRLLAAAESLPIHVMIGPDLMTRAVKAFHPELRRGDAFLHNDPYRGGLHCPENTFFKPFFEGGELKGFAVCIGHIAEIGGMVPGAFCGEATEIFHEGLRVRPVKTKKAGKDVDEV
jgi:5-oxoprolinase (ATP-hydrolysing)/N-methylhydantoinase B